MANLINLENVSKTWGLKTLLDGVSLGIQTADRIGIVGVNGGGKTTLLEVLTGIEAPDSGRVSHNSDPHGGGDTTLRNSRRRHRRRRRRQTLGSRDVRVGVE